MGLLETPFNGGYLAGAKQTSYVPPDSWTIYSNAWADGGINRTVCIFIHGVLGTICMWSLDYIFKTRW